MSLALASRTGPQVLGLGLGLGHQVLGLGLGLGPKSLASTRPRPRPRTIIIIEHYDDIVISQTQVLISFNFVF